MADLTKREKLAKASLYDIGYEYLRDNFYKFNQAHKIKVAISILQIFEKDDSKTPLPENRVVVFVQEKVKDGNQGQEGRLSTSVSIVPE